MNKLYRIVWSQVRNAWVVASELASSVTRAGGRRRVKRVRADIGGDPQALRTSMSHARSVPAMLLAASALVPIDSAHAACPPGTICVSMATDTGDASQVGTFSWAIAQANAGGDQIISFDDAVFAGPTPTLTLTGTNVSTPRVSASVTIDGSNVPNLVIDGSGQREIPRSWTSSWALPASPEVR